MIQEKRADLHLHSFHSDGTFSPEEVVRRAISLKLAAISLTDHDTIEGLPAARAAAGHEIEMIPGVELTVAFKDREIHLLGYGIQEGDSHFSAFLKKRQLRRRHRIQEMIDRLRAHGVEVTLEEVTAVAGQGTIGRPHLAEVLVKKKVVSSFEEAFERYLGDRAPCFVKGVKLTVAEAVRLIGDVGGVTVVAHPHRIVDDAWFPELVAAGLQGVEAYHSDHDAVVTKKYLQIAEKYHLLATGGSDCHGFRKSKGPLIGTVTVPYSHVEKLKEAVARSAHLL